jgi:hypothetical protein
MSKLFSDKKDGEISKPQEVVIQGTNLSCTVCQNNTFWEYKTLLNQETQAMFDLEAFAEKTKSYVCSKCGLKLEFLQK